MISDTGTPSCSAAICARMVSEPVPRSVAPISRLKEPSSFILMVAAPISNPAIPLPWIMTAIPMPRLIGPLWFLYFFAFGVEVGGLQTNLDAFINRAGSHGLVVTFPAFAQLARHVHILAKLEPVVAFELDHVEIQFFSNLFHQDFNGELSLHGTVAAVRAGRRGGGVNHIADKARIGRVIQCQAFETAHHIDRQAMGAVSAGIADQTQFLGNQLVILDAQFIAQDLAVA